MCVRMCLHVFMCVACVCMFVCVCVCMWTSGSWMHITIRDTAPTSTTSWSSSGRGRWGYVVIVRNGEGCVSEYGRVWTWCDWGWANVRVGKRECESEWEWDASEDERMLEWVCICECKSEWKCVHVSVSETLRVRVDVADDPHSTHPSSQPDRTLLGKQPAAPEHPTPLQTWPTRTSACPQQAVRKWPLFYRNTKRMNTQHKITPTLNLALEYTRARARTHARVLLK